MLQEKKIGSAFQILDFQWFTHDRVESLASEWMKFIQAVCKLKSVTVFQPTLSF